MNVGSFIGGILIAAVGYLLIWKSDWLMINFGRIGWAEKHLHTAGGSRLMYKIIGTIIIIAGFLKATALGGLFVKWVANSIFGANIQ